MEQVKGNPLCPGWAVGPMHVLPPPADRDSGLPAGTAAEELERSAVNKTIPRTKVYFCHPYSSWERGSNENANSMIRRRHPKGTDFSKVSAAEIAATEEWINNYPRKIFGYKSSEVMFRECLREIGLIA